MSTLQIKKGDRYPSIAAILTVNGSPINLSGCTVKFQARNSLTGVVKINGDAVVVDATTGSVRYDQTDEDMDTAGRYEAEWEITLPSTKKVTIPNDGFDILVIVDSIA